MYNVYIPGWSDLLLMFVQPELVGQTSSADGGVERLRSHHHYRRVLSFLSAFGMFTHSPVFLTLDQVPEICVQDSYCHL